MLYFIGFAGFAKTKRYVVGRIVGTAPVKSACSILFYLSRPWPTLNIQIRKKILSLSIIVFHGTGVQSGVSGVMESKASTLLMTHKKAPLMVTLFETLDGFIQY